jgi:hypothetical protein
MKLDDLCETLEKRKFPALGVQAHPDREDVVALRAAVSKAVADDEFLAECLSMELARIKENRLHLGFAPFFTHPSLGVRFALGLWLPRGGPGPHEHTAWTITAVCRNTLEVVVYHREESYRRRELMLKERINATAGQVGFIYDPCIHAPVNSSNDYSLSLHISSPRDGDPLDDHKEPIVRALGELSPEQRDHPYTYVTVARERLTAAHQFARVLAPMKVPQAPQLLARCYELASSATRDWIDRTAPRFQAPRQLGNEEQRRTSARWVLQRAHPDLKIQTRAQGERIALEVETPEGPVDEIVLHDETHAAHAALAFIAREPIFDIRDLPGNFSSDEQSALGEALEESGLFARMYA